MKKVIPLIALLISMLLLITFLLLFSKLTTEKFCSLIPQENKDAIQSCCNEWAKENNIGHIKCAGEWIIEEGECSYACNLPPEPGPLHWCMYPPGGSNKTEDELVQECCNEWASENQIVHAQCLGEWGYFGGYECKWGCFI